MIQLMHARREVLSHEEEEAVEAEVEDVVDVVEGVVAEEEDGENKAINLINTQLGQIQLIAHQAYPIKTCKYMIKCISESSFCSIL